MELSEKLNHVLERLNNKEKAIHAHYMNEDGGGCEYYFYYNRKNDPVLVECPEGTTPNENSIGINIPSSVHLDYDLRSNSLITESQLTRIIQAYKILTENILRKNVKNGRVVRKRVALIDKPKQLSDLKNKIDGKKAALYSQTAIANVKRKRSNNVRDVLNLDKQPKETIMNRNDIFNQRSRLSEARYCTYPQAHAIAETIIAAMQAGKIKEYQIKYPTPATATITQRGYCVEFGPMNRKWMAEQAMSDYIARDILGRYGRGEDIDQKIKYEVGIDLK